MKPIIAMTFSGFIVDDFPWKNADKKWFEKFAKYLNDSSILEWGGKSNYFEGVDKVMQQAFPDLSEEERTKKARDLFFESVLDGIKENPNKNQEIIDYLNSLKENFKIALISTNTKKAMIEILSLYELENFFDIVETSLLEEKDDKKLVFERFIKKYDKPIVYLAGDNKKTMESCKELGINCVHAVNMDLKELKELIQSLKNKQA